jgi:predicted acylesterase/phospholipase RssA
MHGVVRKPAIRARARSPFECIALLLQDGGALGSYQAGVRAGFRPLRKS